MKKLLLLLSAMLIPFSNVQAQKLGSDDDPIRQMLFANQPLKELVKRTTLDGSTNNPFQTITEASKLAEEGKKTDAVSKLRSVLQTQPPETRVELFVWSGLRELGEKPDPKSGTEVLGVIIEVPMSGGYDTLAAYADGSARYLNYSSSGIFWDKPDDIIKSLCTNFIKSTLPASGSAKPRNGVSLPKTGTQVTLLTRSGNYVITAPPESVMNAGAKLMIELIHRSKEKKS
jgi:hypothetical protein